MKKATKNAATHIDSLQAMFDLDYDGLASHTGNPAIFLRDRAFRRLTQKVRRGDREAVEQLDTYARETIRVQAVEFIKKRETVKARDENGEAFTASSMIGVPIKNEQGKDTSRYVQLSLWLQPWSVLEAYGDRFEMQIKRLTRKMKVYKKIMAVHAQFPDSLTPGEAFDRAGLSRDEIDIGQFA